MTKQADGLKILHAILLVAFAALMTIFYSVIAILVSRGLHYPLEKDLGLAYLINIFCFSLILFASVHLFNVKPGSIFPFKPIRLRLYPVLIVAFTGLVILSSELDNLCRFFFHIEPLQIFADAIEYNYWGALIAIVVLAPLAEETFFRGFILQNLLKRYPAYLGITVSAVLFSLFHMTLQQIPTAFVAGLLLGWCFSRTRSILPVLIGHAFNNSFSFLMDFFNIRIIGFNDGMAIPSGAQFQPLWFDGLGLLLLAVGIWLFARWTRDASLSKPSDETPNFPESTTSTGEFGG